MKALGLCNLNSYSRMEIIGVKGKRSVDIVISIGRRIVCFVFSNCHFIFMLFVDGNIVSDVE